MKIKIKACIKERNQKHNRKHCEIALEIGDRFWGKPCTIDSEHNIEGKTERYTRDRGCIACHTIRRKSKVYKNRHNQANKN